MAARVLNGRYALASNPVAGGAAMVYKASDLQSDMRHVAVKLFAASQAHTRLRAEFFGRVCVTAAHRCSTVAAEQVLAPARAGPAICRAAVWRDRAEIDGIAEPSRT